MSAPVVAPERGNLHALRQHPFELAIAASFFVLGAVFILSGFALPISKVLFTLPYWERAIFGVTLVGAGPLMVAGLVAPVRDVMGRAIERAGLWLAVGAMASYGVAVLLAAPWAITSWFLPFVFAAGCYGRIRMIREVDKAVEGVS